MPPLARRNLVHDRVRLAVTITGIVFAVVLIVIELGLFLGFATTTSNLMDRGRADLWMTAAHVSNIESARPSSERKLSTSLSTPGGAEARKYIVFFPLCQRQYSRYKS